MAAGFPAPRQGFLVVRDADPGCIRLANSWLILNLGGGPTPDKPDISLRPPEDAGIADQFLNLRVADIAAAYAEWSARGAVFLTPPIPKQGETRCYLRDPDGYLIEVGEAVPELAGGGTGPGSEGAAPYHVPEPRFPDHAFGAAMPAANVGACRLVHAGHVAAINRLLEPYPDLASRTIEALLSAAGDLPPELRDAMLEAGGGHANRQFFWKIVGPPTGRGPSGALLAAIDRDFGGVDALRRRFIEAGQAAGAGWVFLSLSAAGRSSLDVLALPGQGSVLPLAKPGLIACDLSPAAWVGGHPSVDAWLAAFWTIIDWAVVDQRFARFAA